MGRGKLTPEEQETSYKESKCSKSNRFKHSLYKTDEKKEQLDELAAAKRKLVRQEEKIRKQGAEIEALKKLEE